MRTHEKARELEAMGLAVPSPNPRKPKSPLPAVGSDVLSSPAGSPTALTQARKRSHSDMSAS